MISTKSAPPKSRPNRSGRKPTVVLLWAEHFDAQAAVNFTTQLRDAGTCVYITSPHQQKIRGKYGIALYTDVTIHDVVSMAEQISCIIVPADASGLQTIAYEPRLAALFAQVGQNQGMLVIQGLADAELDKVDLPLEGLALFLSTQAGVEREPWVDTLLTNMQSL